MATAATGMLRWKCAIIFPGRPKNKPYAAFLTVNFIHLAFSQNNNSHAEMATTTKRQYDSSVVWMCVCLPHALVPITVHARNDQQTNKERTKKAANPRQKNCIHANSATITTTAKMPPQSPLTRCCCPFSALVVWWRRKFVDFCRIRQLDRFPPNKRTNAWLYGWGEMEQEEGQRNEKNKKIERATGEA